MIEHAKGAVYAVFALAGAAFAAFASRIPEIKAILDLSAGELGISLLAASLGSLLGLPAAGWFVHRIGAARTVGAGVIIGMIGILTIGLGVDVFASRWIVTAGLWGVGLGVGSWDVAMNIEGAVVERHLGRAIMPRFHAAFSGGTVISALIGAAMAAIGARILPHLIGIIVLVVAVATWALPKFLPRQAHDVPQDAGDTSSRCCRGNR
ncbi:MAG: MFS transporter [Dermatophilaceae bacterium]